MADDQARKDTCKREHYHACSRHMLCRQWVVHLGHQPSAYCCHCLSVATLAWTTSICLQHLHASALRCQSRHNTISRHAAVILQASACRQARKLRCTAMAAVHVHAAQGRDKKDIGTYPAQTDSLQALFDWHGLETC